MMTTVKVGESASGSGERRHAKISEEATAPEPCNFFLPSFLPTQ